jgi:hypothetical protein
MAMAQSFPNDMPAYRLRWYEMSTRIRQDFFPGGGPKTMDSSGRFRTVLIGGRSSSLVQHRGIGTNRPKLGFSIPPTNAYIINACPFHSTRSPSSLLPSCRHRPRTEELTIYLKAFTTLAVPYFLNRADQAEKGIRRSNKKAFAYQHGSDGMGEPKATRFIQAQYGVAMNNPLLVCHLGTRRISDFTYAPAFKYTKPEIS